MYLTKKIYWPILLISDIVGNIFFFWTKLRKRPASIRKALFIRLEHIGDMVMTTPVFENFKKSNPGCEIHVLCKTITRPIIENNPYVDRIITFDPDWMLKRHEDKKKKFSELITGLKKEKYDIVFEMHGDPRNNRLAYRTGAYTAGYACRGAGFFLNEIHRYNPKIHNIDQNLNLIRDYAKITTRKTKIYTGKRAKDNASRIMKRYNLKKNYFIIINPMSGRLEKNLTDKEVNEFIKKHKKSSIFITGSKSEHEYNKRFERQKARVMNICGTTDLLTLTELVRNARLVIAPDTGIIHIAKSVGTRFEAVYKATDRKIWGY